MIYHRSHAQYPKDWFLTEFVAAAMVALDIELMKKTLPADAVIILNNPLYAQYYKIRDSIHANVQKNNWT